MKSDSITDQRKLLRQCVSTTRLLSTSNKETGSNSECQQQNGHCAMKGLTLKQKQIEKKKKNCIDQNQLSIISDTNNQIRISDTKENLPHPKQDTLKELHNYDSSHTGKQQKWQRSSCNQNNLKTSSRASLMYH